MPYFDLTIEFSDDTSRRFVIKAEDKTAALFAYFEGSLCDYLYDLSEEEAAEYFTQFEARQWIPSPFHSEEDMRWFSIEEVKTIDDIVDYPIRKE